MRPMVEKFAKALEVPLYRLFDGDDPVRNRISECLRNKPIEMDYSQRRYLR